jgi:hypothetical protein
VVCGGVHVCFTHTVKTVSICVVLLLLLRLPPTEHKKEECCPAAARAPPSFNHSPIGDVHQQARLPVPGATGSTPEEAFKFWLGLPNEY